MTKLKKKLTKTRCAWCDKAFRPGEAQYARTPDVAHAVYHLPCLVKADADWFDLDAVEARLRPRPRAARATTPRPHDARGVALRRYFASLRDARDAGLEIDRRQLQGGRSAKALDAQEFHALADQLQQQAHDHLARRRDALADAAWDDIDRRHRAHLHERRP